MLVYRLSCITIVLGFSFAAESLQFEKRSQSSKDCTDVYLKGNHLEGYYAVVPNVNEPNEGALVYCGVNDGMLPLNTSAPKASPQNCQDLKNSGMTDSGLNVIYPYMAHPETPVIVYCDQELLGGGWTVFQRRDDFDTQLDFYKPFDEYSLGFGNPGGEFWLGLDILHEITQIRVNELYVDLTSFDNVNKYAHYKSFYVAPKAPTALSMGSYPYYMTASHYSGDAGDSFSYHNGMAFSTYDNDHDMDDDYESAEFFHGAWWYKNHKYYSSNLNGLYAEGKSNSDLIWWTFSQGVEPLKKVVMQVRPLVQQ